MTPPLLLLLMVMVSVAVRLDSVSALQIKAAAAADAASGRTAPPPPQSATVVREGADGEDSTESPVAFGVNIGTKAGGIDVMKQNQLAPQYTKPPEMEKDSLSGLAVVGGNVDSSSFYIGLTGDQTLQLTKPITFTETGEVCTPVLTNREKIVNVTKATPFTVTLNYNCLDIGEALVFVQFTFYDEKQRQPILIAFRKTCKEIHTAPGSLITGLRVGRTSNAADVIKDGLTDDAYRVSRGEDGEPEAQIDDRADFVTFYFHSDRPQIKIHRPAVFVSKHICEPIVTGTLSRDETLKANEDAELTLTFNCRKKGTTMLTLQFVTSAATIHFSFMKQCGDKIVDGIAIQGFNIGTQDGLSDVVLNGFTQPRFTVAANATAAKDAQQSRYTLPEEEDLTRFYVDVASEGDNGEIEFDKAFVVAQQSTIARPFLTGGITQGSRLVAGSQFLDIGVNFNCAKEGTTEVTVSLHLQPPYEGNIRFLVLKKCPANNTNYKEDVNSLVGFHIGSDNRVGFQDDVVKDGIPTQAYDGRTPEGSLRQVHEAEDYVSFYLTSATSSTTRRYFGAPRATPSYSLLNIDVSGPASAGGVIKPGHSLELGLTFECEEQGVTPIVLGIPLLNGADGAVTADTNWIYVHFVKQCPAYTPRGGFFLMGFNVGLTPNGSEVVKDGFPTSTYFGQRLRQHPEWVPVPQQQLASTFFIWYRPPSSVTSTTATGQDVADLIGDDDGDDKNATSAISASTGTSAPFKRLPLSSSGSVSVPTVAPNRNTVLLSSPGLINHYERLASPELSGEAADGGVVGLDPLELDLTYNCITVGTAAITVKLPLAQGMVSFTVPKNCRGGEIAGKGVPGLLVGTTPDSEDVVVNGFPTSAYTKYKPGQRGSRTLIPFVDSETTFYVRRVGLLSQVSKQTDIKGQLTASLKPRPITIGEPTVVCHRPSCDAVLTGELMTGLSADDEVVLNDTVRALTVRYSCMWTSSSPVTITLPLADGGEVMWTVTKDCDNAWDGTGYDDEEEDDAWFTGADEETEGDDASGVTDTEGFPNNDEEEDLDAEAAEARDWEEWGPDSQFDDDFDNEGAEDGTGYDMSRADDEEDYDSYDDPETQDQDLDENDLWADIDEHHWQDTDLPPTVETKPKKGSKGADTVPDETEKDSQSAAGYINVGTAPGLTDVVHNGVLSPGFKMPPTRKTDEYYINQLDTVDLLHPLTREQLYKVIRGDQSTVTFHLSLPAGERPQAFDHPKILAEGMDICRPKVSYATVTAGPSLKANDPTAADAMVTPVSPQQQQLEVRPDQSVVITLQLQCLRDGVTPVLVTLPLVSSERNFVSWRFVKICGNNDTGSWTAAHVFGVLVVAAVAVGGVYLYVKRMRKQSSLAAI